MKVAYRSAGLWPFPEVIGSLSRRPPRSFQLAGEDEIAFHNLVRDDIAALLRTAPGGAAIVEVEMRATMAALRADADIVARSRTIPAAATAQAFFEVKTGLHAEIRPN
ncbi:MAG TPA: hypothetical protein VGM87_10130 [Roseomonas sp.]